MLARKENAGPESDDDRQYRILHARFVQANSGDLKSLPKISEYSGKKTAAVYTDQAAILDKGKKTDGLFTCYAWQCCVVVAVVRSEFTNEVQRVGMLHISPSGYAEAPKAVDDFLRKMRKGAEGGLEITIISGIGGHSEKVFADCRKQGKIAFMNCDKRGDREDRVIVDRNGTVYYQDGGESSLNARFGYEIEKYIKRSWRKSAGLSPVDRQAGPGVKYLRVE